MDQAIGVPNSGIQSGPAMKAPEDPQDVQLARELMDRRETLEQQIGRAREHLRELEFCQQGLVAALDRLGELQTTPQAQPSTL